MADCALGSRVADLGPARLGAPMRGRRLRVAVSRREPQPQPALVRHDGLRKSPESAEALSSCPAGACSGLVSKGATVAKLRNSEFVRRPGAGLSLQRNSSVEAAAYFGGLASGLASVLVSLARGLSPRVDMRS